MGIALQEVLETSRRAVPAEALEKSKMLKQMKSHVLIMVILLMFRRFGDIPKALIFMVFVMVIVVMIVVSMVMIVIMPMGVGVFEFVEKFMILVMGLVELVFQMLSVVPVTVTGCELLGLEYMVGKSMHTVARTGRHSHSPKH
jgi:hypothetical protein